MGAMLARFLLLPLAIACTLELAGCASPWSVVRPLSGYAWRSAGVSFLPDQTYAVAASSDGRRLAFSTAEGLFMGDIGGQARKVADSEGGIIRLTWSGDGRHVIAWGRAYEPELTPGGSKPAGSPPHVLKRFSVADEKLTTIAENTGWLFIQASPDGKRLAVGGQLNAGDPREKLYLYDLETERMEAIEEAAFVGSHLEWSPDGAYLAAFKPGPGQTPVLQILPMSDRKPVELPQAAAFPTQCYPQLATFFWEPTGEGLTAYQLLDGQRLLLTTYSPQGAKLREKTLMAWSREPDTTYTCLRASADGQYLVGTKMGSRSQWPTPAESTVSWSIARDTIEEIAPPVTFHTWLGRSARFLASEEGRNTRRFTVVEPR